MMNGSCICGRFTFEVDGPFGFMGNCHCTYCRKLHGATFATYVSATAAGFRWRRGEGEQAFYESSPGVKRPFCPDCGSKVPGPPQGDSVGIEAGLLDGDPGIRPQMELYLRHKAPWYTPRADVPAFDSLPPGMPGWEDPHLPTPPRPKLAREGTTAGSCLCSTVSWETEGPPARMGHCHCSRCRKARSAAFSTQIMVAPGAFRWLSGQEDVREFPLPGARYFSSSFCRHCGSPVARATPGVPMVLVPAGALDDDPGVRPSGHIYVGSKAPWYEITDGLPQFEERPGV